MKKAAEKKAKDDAKRGIVDGPTLEPASETGAPSPRAEVHEAEQPHYDDEDGDDED